MNLVSSRAISIANKNFQTESEWVISQLQSYCEDLSEFLTESPTPDSCERFCLAILKIGKTSKQKITQAIELGETDYRDLLVAAGFGNSLTAHSEWADRKLNKTNEKTFIFGALYDSSELKKYGISILFGFIGATISALIFGEQSKPIVFIISVAVTLFGYFVVANNIVKRK